MKTRLLVVGGGNMGSALVKGLLATGWDPSSLSVAEADQSRRVSLSGDLPGVAMCAEPVPARGVVVAVKPADAENACRSVAEVGADRVLSIMAGIPLARLESWFVPAVAVVRAMPNTPALVGVGASALAGGFGTDESDLRWAEEILGAVGIAVRVREELLDAVTGVSGSGPAYLFYMAEAMIRAGVGLGLPEEVSRALVLQTFAGSARMLTDSGETPEVLRGRVTSPGGTTEAGLGILSAHHVSEAVVEAVSAAADRSHELGR